jgi:hypothetical protein
MIWPSAKVLIVPKAAFLKAEAQERIHRAKKRDKTNA